METDLNVQRTRAETAETNLKRDQDQRETMEKELAKLREELKSSEGDAARARQSVNDALELAKDMERPGGQGKKYRGKRSKRAQLYRDEIQGEAEKHRQNWYPGLGPSPNSSRIRLKMFSLSATKILNLTLCQNRVGVTLT